MKNRATYVLAIVWLALLLAACGPGVAASTSKNTSHDYGVAASGSSTRVMGGTDQEDAVLQSVLDGMGQSGILAANIGTPPEQFGRDGAPVWLSVDVHYGGASVTNRSQWEAMLVAGAFRDEAATDGLPGVAGYSIRFIDDSGSDVGSGDASFAVEEPTDVSVNEGSADNIGSSIESSLQRAGLNVRSLSFVAPLDLAPVIVAETDDPKGFIATNQQLADLLGADVSSFEGVYLEVVDSAGDPMLISGSGTRTGQGVLWIRPDLQTLAPAQGVPSQG